jgi:hypothetical protein
LAVRPLAPSTCAAACTLQYFNAVWSMILYLLVDTSMHLIHLSIYPFIHPSIPKLDSHEDQASSQAPIHDPEPHLERESLFFAGAQVCCHCCHRCHCCRCCHCPCNCCHYCHCCCHCCGCHCCCLVCYLDATMPLYGSWPMINGQWSPLRSRHLAS